ncbi:MAG: BMP family lipoprotein, partial [Lactococcus garvieae]
YAGSFSDAGKGKTIASAMYSGGADIIYQAAGGVGTGVFTEARVLNETKNEADKVWVIGVDRDQESEGDFKSKDGKDSNFVLASTLKEVGNVVKDVSNKTKDNKFPGGEILKYDLKNSGVALARNNTSDEAWKAVETAKEKIINGEITVPAK